MKISLRRCHTLLVEICAFTHKIDYVTIFKAILNLKGHPNCITGSKVTANFDELVDFAYWWSFSGEGSAPAAYAAGLFRYYYQIVKGEQKMYLHVLLFALKKCLYIIKSSFLFLKKL